ncbi:MAG: hypothetical protein M1541_19135 [Acidobacteria bacterium]|nr:hypothetical protein [Acidobacteriota bacterium]
MPNPKDTCAGWLQRSLNIHFDRSRGAAPHKPLLLLVVFDLIEDAKLTGGLLARDGNLAFRFSSSLSITAERGMRGRMCAGRSPVRGDIALAHARPPVPKPRKGGIFRS